jgi:chromosome segregation ATPase
LLSIGRLIAAEHARFSKALAVWNQESRHIQGRLGKTEDERRKTLEKFEAAQISLDTARVKHSEMEGRRHELDRLNAEITIAERAKEAALMENVCLQEELHIERAQQKTVLKRLTGLETFLQTLIERSSKSPKKSRRLPR